MPALMPSLLLLACGPKDPVRTAQQLDAPPPPPPIVAPPAPPRDQGFAVYEGWGPGAPMQVAWTLKVDAPVVSTPLVVEGDFVVAAGDALLRIGREGEVAWRLPGPHIGSPAWVSGEIWAPFGPKMVRLDPDGRELGQDTRRESEILGPAVTLEQGGAYLLRSGETVSVGGTGKEALSAAGPPCSDGQHLLFATEEGELVAWTPEGVAWVRFLDGPGRGRPATDLERAYVTTASFDGRPGSLFAVDLGDGEVQWQRPLRFQSLGELALYGDDLLLPEPGGVVHAIDRRTGETSWELDLGVGLTTGLAVAGTRAYVGTSSGRLVAIDLDDGVVWTQLELDATPVGQPAISGKTLLLGTADGRLLGVTGP